MHCKLFINIVIYFLVFCSFNLRVKPLYSWFTLVTVNCPSNTTNTAFSSDDDDDDDDGDGDDDNGDGDGDGGVRQGTKSTQTCSEVRVSGKLDRELQAVVTLTLVATDETTEEGKETVEGGRRGGRGVVGERETVTGGGEGRQRSQVWRRVG